MLKPEAKEQFNYLTDKLNIEHTFSFDEAWSFVEHKRKHLIRNPISFLPANYTKEEFRNGIVKVEERIKNSNSGMIDDELQKYNPLKHSFAHGQYIREIFNPAGELLVTKIHKFAHPFFLLQGDMTILYEGGKKRIQAPHYGITEAGTKRIIYTHTDCIFVTVHATNKKDIKEIEDEIITKDFIGDNII